MLCTSQLHVHVRRLNRRSQQSGETAEQYIMVVYDLAENCDYGDIKEEMIHDRLVVSIRDGHVHIGADITLYRSLVLPYSQRN